ncbi:MAG: SHOCT domain-containing protein [Acidobacteriota bacterium]
MNVSKIFHRFLFSIVLAAPFYNLMNKSENKLYLIGGLLIILNLIIYFIVSKAKKTRLLKPVTIQDREQLAKFIKTHRKKKHKPAPERVPSEVRLREIKRLFDSGLITQEEYNNKKEEIINEL